MFRIPERLVERVVHHHADETTHNDRRVDFQQRSFALSVAQVGSEKLVNLAHHTIKEHLREFVLLESGIKEQPLKLGIDVVMVERAESERLKHAAIVFARDRVSGYDCGIERTAAGARLMIENGRVELFFGREVAKDHRFGNAGGLGNLFCGSTSETSVGKETYSDAEDLEAAFFAGHSGAVWGKRTVVGGGDWLTHLLLYYLSSLCL